MDLCEPTPERKLVLNFPAAVELSMPNLYADRIAWFQRNVSGPDAVLISLHPHNDGGTAVAFLYVRTAIGDHEGRESLRMTTRSGRHFRANFDAVDSAIAASGSRDPKSDRHFA